MRSSSVSSFLHTPDRSNGAFARGAGVAARDALPITNPMTSDTARPHRSAALTMVVKLRSVGARDLDETAASLAALQRIELHGDLLADLERIALPPIATED